MRPGCGMLRVNCSPSPDRSELVASGVINLTWKSAREFVEKLAYDDPSEKVISKNRVRGDIRLRGRPGSLDRHIRQVTRDLHLKPRMTMGECNVLCVVFQYPNKSLTKIFILTILESS